MEAKKNQIKIVTFPPFLIFDTEEERKKIRGIL